MENVIKLLFSLVYIFLCNYSYALDVKCSTYVIVSNNNLEINDIILNRDLKLVKNIEDFGSDQMWFKCKIIKPIEKNIDYVLNLSYLKNYDSVYLDDIKIGTTTNDMKNFFWSFKKERKYLIPNKLFSLTDSSYLYIKLIRAIPGKINLSSDKIKLSESWQNNKPMMSELIMFLLGVVVSIFTLIFILNTPNQKKYFNEYLILSALLLSVILFNSFYFYRIYFIFAKYLLKMHLVITFICVNFLFFYFLKNIEMLKLHKPIKFITILFSLLGLAVPVVMNETSFYKYTVIIFGIWGALIIILCATHAHTILKIILKKKWTIPYIIGALFLIFFGGWDVIQLTQGKIPVEFSTSGAGFLAYLIFSSLGYILLGTESKYFILEKSLIESEAKYSIATQVAHDIRSPLAALDMVLKDMEDIPESKRIMIRGSVSRIHDIANDLLLKNKNKTISIEKEQENKNYDLTNIMLSDLLSTLISEKRLQLRNNVNLKLESNIDNRSYGLFAKINVSEFSRLISNIINNAFEALTNESGKITLDLLPNPNGNEELQIIIQDNGKGIPKELLSKLGIKGNTFGKKKGSGLGLFHAKSTIESWGGSLFIESMEEKGTKVIINLPKSELPKTFIKNITVNSSDTIVIVDDDQSIHQIWKGRFESSANEKTPVPKLIHFSDPQKFKDWFKTNKTKIKNYLIDYEFLGHKINGVEIIKDLNIESNSILVTSRYTEDNVREKCETGNIKLLPKGLAVYVSINIIEATDINQTTNKRLCNIFIDDERLIRFGWKSNAKKNNVELDIYESGDELLDVIDKYDKNSTFYIDSSLGNNVKGEDVARKLFELGFLNLYLATGYDKDYFTSNSIDIGHIKEIVSKEAPWS